MDKPNFLLAVVMINTICTLRCKHCITRTPYQKNPHNFPAEEIERDVDATFELCGHVSHLDFEGGESLMHPDLPRLVDYAFGHIEKGHCDEVRILTNGTLLPSEALLETCKRGKVLLLVDDYGPQLSTKKDQLVAVLEENGIPYRIDTYHGDGQYCGGWIDLGDYSFKGDTPQKLQWRIDNCCSAHNGPYIREGKLFLCEVQMSTDIPLVEGEYIDLRSDSMTFEEKLDILSQFGKKPVNHCNYCNGFIRESERIPAAEQL